MKLILPWMVLILLLLPGVSHAVEAPTPHPAKIGCDVELFINVYNAVFDAKRTKSKRSIQLWDALVDQDTYKEVNLDRPYEFWNWSQARALRRDYIKEAHGLLTKGTISDPQKALWQRSRIDGYRKARGGEVVVYTRYVRRYQGRNRFGFAIFKIKNADKPLDIKKWNEPPYDSNWKICEMRWKPITQPLYNKKVFKDYPIVDW